MVDLSLLYHEGFVLILGNAKKTLKFGKVEQNS